MASRANCYTHMQRGYYPVFYYKIMQTQEKQETKFNVGDRVAREIDGVHGIVVEIHERDKYYQERYYYVVEWGTFFKERSRHLGMSLNKIIDSI